MATKYTHEEMIEKFGWDIGAYGDPSLTDADIDEMRDALFAHWGTSNIHNPQQYSKSHLTNNNDPLDVDPRPIRHLNDVETQNMKALAKKGFYAAIAGFEMFRGKDRWMYTDILRFYPTPDFPENDGMPVGPLDEEFISQMRIFGEGPGEQLACRILDPRGYEASQSGYSNNGPSTPLNFGIGDYSEEEED